MINHISPPKNRLSYLLLSIVILLMGFSFITRGQTTRDVEGERAICKVKINDKVYQPKLNQIGYFERVSNIPLDTIVNIEISYPDGNENDKVVLFVEDGGIIDNGKTVKIIQLDNSKKFSFTFRFIPDDPGIYRITLRKGNDTKVVQLWAIDKTSK